MAVRIPALVLGGTAALFTALWAALWPALSAAPQQAGRSADARAVAYLSREVPAWREEHPCY